MFTNKPLPKVTTVKRPLVLVSAAVVLFLLIFALVNAFDVSKAPAPKSTTPEVVKNTIVNTNEVNPFLAKLPEGYNDAANVKKFLGDTEAKENAIKTLEVQLQELKADNFIMRRQIEALNTKPPKKEQENLGEMSEKNKQASSSGLFFSGVGQSGGNLLTGRDGNVQTSGDKQTGTAVTADPVDQSMEKLPLSKRTKFYNKQTLKNQTLSVLKATDNVEDIYDLHNMATLASPYEIQTGSIIPAVLITAVNTSVAGTVVAQVRFNIYDTVTGKYLLVPKGSRIVGEYDSKAVSYGQQRVLISFNRILRPDGSSILVGKPTAADMQGEGGVEGNVNNHWGKVLSAATMSTILSVAAGVVSDNSSNKNTDYRSARQNAILGASSGINQVGASLTNRAIDIQPTITIPTGFQFNIIVRRDMVMTPYTVGARLSRPNAVTAPYLR